MPNEPWRNVAELLVAFPGSTESMSSAMPALSILDNTLPDTEITLWAVGPNTRNPKEMPGVDQLLLGPAAWTRTLRPLINALRNRHFDAAIIFTAYGESPYPAAYACYLAGIPVRLGQSHEFGGGVLSLRVKPLPFRPTPEVHFLHLLAEAGFQEAVTVLADYDKDRDMITVGSGSTAKPHTTLLFGGDQG